MRIGIDLMGSESSPTVLFEAVLRAVKSFTSKDCLVIYITHSAYEKILSISQFRSYIDSVKSIIDLHLVQDEIEMEDDPLSAIRLKKESSLVIGISQLKEKKIDAFISSGNTGALVGSASLTLPKFYGMERSCLLASLPSREDPLAIVDVGGFLSTSADQLLQYAKVGAAYQSCLLGKKRPLVGLVNIGAESRKGTHQVQQAYRILTENKSDKFQFIGNVEGREAFQGDVDVLVTDGFTGNVMLKVSQGVSSFIFDHLQTSLKGIHSDEMHQQLNRLHDHFKYDNYPGALLCGVEGIIIKCHGATSVSGMYQSILGAKKYIQLNLLDFLKIELSSYF